MPAVLNKHKITIIDTNEVYWCSEDKHLLQGMLSLGKRGIPSGCHGGGCGICKIHIRTDKSSYVSLPMSRSRISEDEELQGIVLACRIYPRNDIELNVVGGIKKNVLRPTGSFTFNYASNGND